MLSAICANFEVLPDYCGGGTKSNANPLIIIPNADEGISGKGLIGIVVLLIFVNLMLIMMYKKCSNREMKDDMQMQVNSEVSRYFAISNKNPSMQ